MSIPTPWSDAAAAKRPAASRPPDWRRIGCSILFAAICVLVLGARVHPAFERIRLLALTTPQPAVSTSIDVPLPDLTTLTGAPAAVIVRVRGAEETTQLSIAMDQELLTVVTLPAGGMRRVSTSVFLRPGRGREITVAADRAGWQLESVEVSNAHGFSRGVLSFVVVPRERPRDAAPPVWLLGLVALGLLALRPRLDWARSRAARLAYRVGVGLVLLLFATVLVADLVSPYKILLSLGTFVALAAILYAEAVVRLARHRYAPHLCIAVLFLWSVARFYDPATGFTSLILFGAEFQAQALPVVRELPVAVEPGSGYDGQFYAQLALDPLLRSEEIVAALDGPAYRSRRILLSWVAYLAGLGQPWLVLQAYALLNVVCWLLLAWLLMRWLPPHTPRMTFAWAACLSSHGLMSSVRLSLPDGPSTLLLALGILAIERNRRWLAAAVVAIAGVARETNLLGAAILVPKAAGLQPSDASRRMAAGDLQPPDGTSGVGTALRLAGQGLILVAPLLLWMAYLWSLGLTGGERGEGALAAPLSAYVTKWVATIGELRAEGWSSTTRVSTLTLIALTTQGLFLLWHWSWRNPWWRLGVAYLALMLILGDAVWEGHPGAVTRVVLPLTVAFNVLLPRTRWFWPLWMFGNANIIAAVELLRVPGLSDIF